LFRQSVLGRLAGYGDVNDAERLACDPAMQAIVGREGVDRAAASSSQMGRLETEWLATDANLEALTDLSGAGSTARMNASRPAASSSTWTVPRARPTASRLSAPARQRPQCRGLAPRAGAGDRPLPRAGRDFYFRADAAFAKPEI
jgi:hypothetical protein